MRRRNLIIIGIVVLAVAILLIARNRGGRQDGNEASAVQAEAVSVRTLTARTELASSTSELPGTVEAFAQAQLAPKIMSSVRRVYVREGDRVRKGQLLLDLEARDLAAGVAQARAGVNVADAGARQASEAAKIQAVTSVTRVRQAEAQLSTARAALGQAEANYSMVHEGARKQQKLQAAQSVVQAQAQFDLAKVRYGRMDTLYTQGAIAKQQLDEAKAQHDVSLSALDSAKQQQSLVEEGSRAQEDTMAEQAVRQAKGQLEIADQNLRAAKASAGETRIKREQVMLARAQAQQARASLTQSAVQEGYSSIRAPFDGVVTAKYVDPGTMVAPGAPLMVVQDTHRFRLTATAPEEKARLAVLKTKVQIVLDSVPGRIFNAVIDTVVPAADPQSRTFIIKATLPADRDVRPGAFGRMRLPGPREKGIYFPKEAIWKRGQLTGVYVVKDDFATLRLVTLGRPAGERIQILSGLSDGDVVAVENIEKLKDGARVRAIGDMLGRTNGVSVAVEARR